MVDEPGWHFWVDIAVERGPRADRLAPDMEAGALLCAAWPPTGPTVGARLAEYEAFRERIHAGREAGVSLLGVDDRHWWDKGTMHTLVHIENPIGAPLALVCRICRLWAWTPGGPHHWNPVSAPRDLAASASCGRGPS